MLFTGPGPGVTRRKHSRGQKTALRDRECAMGVDPVRMSPFPIRKAIKSGGEALIASCASKPVGKPATESPPGTPTNSKQINPLRSFPSKIRLPEDSAKCKNYPATSASKFFHYPSSIILLELLLEVSFRFHNHWLHVVVFYSLDVALF